MRQVRQNRHRRDDVRDVGRVETVRDPRGVGCGAIGVVGIVPCHEERRDAGAAVVVQDRRSGEDGGERGGANRAKLREEPRAERSGHGGRILVIRRAHGDVE